MIRGLGYTFGMFIGIPLLLIIVNFLFFRGNQVTQNEVENYIANSKVIEIFIPVGIEHDSEGYYPKLTQGNNIKRIIRVCFYSPAHRKYLELITFNGYDSRNGNNYDNNYTRSAVIHSGGYFLVRANKAQWSDPAYGTEANPVPVFGVKVIENGVGEPQVEFDVPDNLNRIFVEQYLDHFLSKENFKKLFG
ncbi:hypothetical protein MUU49_16385 [Scandinavium goeteborgense]|uniref:hypothetical protein n=1 Tax=Scandinavium goeteborgense TaxID=1851514 RepID=UPI002166130C|nr:hypothetical protein [Scandinavium goeteborgense]MCS2154136.1 hypothetical protein [Scandinavium goeteborgense]